MARLRQFYGSTGVPLVVEGDPHDPVAAWHTQRARLHAFLADLDDDGWAGPTRCEGWDTTLLVRHLASATQFLGYTLHEAAGGTATTLLQGMDTRTTVASAAELLGDRSPAEWRTFLAELDERVDGALDALGGPGLLATAEGPPGHLAAHLVLSHFLFDSWVHEYDLLLPRGLRPVIDPLEARVVVAYLIGLARIASEGAGTQHALDLRISDPDMRIGVSLVDGVVTVSTRGAPTGAAVIEGRSVDVVDRMTGRAGGPVAGDPRGVEVLDRFALVLAT